MKRHVRYAVLLLTLLLVNPVMQAAPRKARPTPQKERAARAALPTPQDDFRKHVEQQIASLKEDVYTRATWKKLEEVRQEAEDTAGRMRLVMFSSAGIGFVLGCIGTFILLRRTGSADDSLKIT